MKNKILLAIADGLGDRPCEVLNYKTPLQFAKTPTLDKIVKNGSAGIMDLYKAGTPVGTDLGHMILFGYGIEDYPGRGPIEAFGEGMELKGGDVAFRCNFATVDPGMKVIDRRAGRIREGTSELAKAISGMKIDDVEVIFKEATEHRAVLVLRGKNLSADVTDTDPKSVDKEVKKCTAKDADESSIKTAEIVNKFIIKANGILEKHPLNEKRKKEGKLPANAILTRGAGQMPEILKTTEKYSLKAACVAAESTVLGVAKLAGFTPITDESFTGNIDTNVEKKAELAVEALKDNDFVALHLKATDLMGHDNNPEGKVKAIELYDHMLSEVLKRIEESIDENVIIALAADHSTPCERMEHSGDPVPIAISGINIRKDAVTKYDEISCTEGALCRMNGNEFINTLLDYLEVTKKEGN